MRLQFSKDDQMRIYKVFKERQIKSQALSFHICKLHMTQLCRAHPGGNEHRGTSKMKGGGFMEAAEPPQDLDDDAKSTQSSLATTADGKQSWSKRALSSCFDQMQPLIKKRKGSDDSSNSGSASERSRSPKRPKGKGKPKSKSKAKAKAKADPVVMGSDSFRL